MNDRQQADARLAEDIRLLGRLLGETIRRHEGEATFDMIEEIRQLAVASRRLDDAAVSDLSMDLLTRFAPAEVLADHLHRLA